MLSKGFARLLGFVTAGGNGQLDNPEGIAVDAAGSVFVAEYGNYRVQNFAATCR